MKKVSPYFQNKKDKNKGKRRNKAEYSYDSGSESGEESGSESDSEPAPPGCEEPPPPGMEDLTDGGDRPAPGTCTPPGVPPAFVEKNDEKEEGEEDEKEKDTKEGECCKFPCHRRIVIPWIFSDKSFKL
jgi:hypothetical protein